MGDSNLKLKFMPFQSLIDPGFWNSLTKYKLDVWKLDEDYKQLRWSYEVSKNFIRFDYDSLDPNKSGEFNGFVRNFNTLENFKVLDKKQLLVDRLNHIREKIEDKTWMTKHLFEPVMICFADLKKYHYYYWLCFPTFKLSSSFEILSESFCEPNQLSCLLESALVIENKICLYSQDNGEICSLENVKDLTNFEKYAICFNDHISDTTDNGIIGNIARNILYVIWKTFGSVNITLIALRKSIKEGQTNYTKSKIFKIKIPDNITEIKSGTGWELSKGKASSKKIDLSASMDAKVLASNACDLNLKLMKWRLQPDIDLDVIKSKKVLLLGSGTLGCNVARVLIGWGSSNITFVDNGTVSFSNPVRQSLFTFEDSVQKKNKADAAAEAIKRIAPMVTTDAVTLSIPMPGHHISVDEMEKNVNKLESLIIEHDVIYLLMDTRESRWLPTVIGKMNNKIVINAALGFDTFMVMRHGVQSTGENNRIKFNRLGCYFCNDVVAPANSTTDRTLDQQCTVSRPGLSLIASSYAVELMVSILQHKDGPYAPAFLDQDNNPDQCCLGPIPHQMRGFLSSFHTMLPTTEAFPQCTACSKTILDMYRSNRNQFLERVFNSTPEYLEDLTGLSAMRNTSDVEVIELSDDDF